MLSNGTGMLITFHFEQKLKIFLPKDVLLGTKVVSENGKHLIVTFDIEGNWYGLIPREW